MTDQTSARILDSHACRLGEGPSYEQENDTLFWFDILESRLFEHRFGAGHTLIHELPFMGSALFSVDDVRQLILGDTGFHVRERATGVLTPHTPVEADNPATRSNDARSHPCGALWFGTMGRDEQKGAGAIYHFHRGKVRLLYPNITVPNSICFSPDGATAYFTDTVTQKLMRVAIDPLTALPAGEPELFFQNTGEGWIDGSVCDAEGNIWNARWGAGAVVCHAPDGSVIATIQVEGSPHTSCPAFVGQSYDRLAITSAFKQLGSAALAAAPHAGKTFVAGIRIKGRPEPRVQI